MFKKINLIIVIIISFFICNNVKALDIELKRYNDWYYIIESKKEVITEDGLINGSEDVVFLKDYKNGDYLINDELYIDDNKIYVGEYNEEDEYQVITDKTNNGYLYFNDDILDNNRDEVKEDNSKIIEDTKKIVNNDNLKSKGYVNRKYNVSTNKVINKLNDKNDIIEYNNDEKGALVYSEEDNKEDKRVKKQSSIWIFIARIIVLIIRKIIVTIKYRNM